MIYMPIVPIESLEMLDGEKNGLVLTHLFDSKKYMEYYTGREWNKLILDMGTFEGQPSTIEHIIDCIDMFDFSLINEMIVVCPDDLYNGDVTYKQTVEFIERTIGRWPISYLAVPQGKNIEEYLESATNISNIKEIDYIGISRLSAETATTDRMTTLSKVMPIIEHKKVHMLGMNSVGECFMASRLYPQIESIDSCIATLYGIHGQDVPRLFSNQHRIETPRDYFFLEMSDVQRSRANHNISIVNSMFV